MKRFILVVTLFFSHFVFAGNNAPVSPDELSSLFKQAHEARNFDSISALINWEGVRKPMRKKIEVYTMGTFGMPIGEISIQEVGEGEFSDFEFGKKDFKPNLPVSHIMKIKFDVDNADAASTEKDTAVYLLGENNGHYMITVYVKEGGSPHGH